MTNKFSFSGWLRKRMKDCGVTQKQLAEMTGITLSTICGYLHDRRYPSYQSMMIISSVLGSHIEIVDDCTDKGGRSDE